MQARPQEATSPLTAFRSGMRRDPALAVYLVFALAITAYDWLAPLALKETLIAYTGWVPSMAYMFSIFFAFAALGNPEGRWRSGVLMMPALQALFGIASWFGLGGAHVSGNPYLRVSPWRPLSTVVLPLAWVAVLAAFRPRPMETTAAR